MFFIYAGFLTDCIGLLWVLAEGSGLQCSAAIVWSSEWPEPGFHFQRLPRPGTRLQLSSSLLLLRWKPLVRRKSVPLPVRLSMLFQISNPTANPTDEIVNSRMFRSGQNPFRWTVAGVISFADTKMALASTTVMNLRSSRIVVWNKLQK